MSERENGAERSLTARESLQSIAVELHRGNELAAASLVMQQRQVDLVGNLLDFIRLQHSNAATGNAQMMDAISGFMGPLGELLGHSTARPPEVRAKAGPGLTPPVVHEGRGTRVEQDAPTVAEDG